MNIAMKNQTIVPVRKSLTVNVSQERAFSVFTRHFAEWWPLETHHIGKASVKTAMIEPRAGGRLYETGVDGSECTWGHVKTWDPPRRLVLSWELSAEWQVDPSMDSIVDVQFISEGPNKTRVELEHRDLQCYGEKAEMVRGGIDSPNGWTAILEDFRKLANSEE